MDVDLKKFQNYQNKSQYKMKLELDITLIPYCTLFIRDYTRIRVAKKQFHVFDKLNNEKQNHV